MDPNVLNHTSFQFIRLRKIKIQKTKTVYLRIVLIPFLWPKGHYYALTKMNYFLQSASGYPVILFEVDFISEALFNFKHYFSLVLGVVVREG